MEEEAVYEIFNRCKNCDYPYILVRKSNTIWSNGEYNHRLLSVILIISITLLSFNSHSHSRLLGSIVGISILGFVFIWFPQACGDSVGGHITHTTSPIAVRFFGWVLLLGSFLSVIGIVFLIGA